MKNGLLLCIAMMITGSIFAQSVPDSLDRDQLDPGDRSTQAEQEISLQDQKRFDTDLTVGTSIIYSPGNFYGPSMFIAPSVSYQLSPRFILSSGIALEHGNFYPLYGESNQDQALLPMTRAFMFARGSYRISERLTLGGTAYKGINTMPQLTNYSRPYSYNYEALSFDINYKISDAFSVGFQMRLQNGNYNYQEGLIPPAGYIPGRDF